MKALRNRGLTKVELAAIVGGVLALNIAAAVIYKVKFKSAPAAPVQPTTLPPASPAPVAEAESTRFKELRAAGLTALSAGDHARAVAQFTEALKFGKADSDIIELLKMAKEFHEKGTSPQPDVADQPEASAPEPAPEKPARPQPVAVAKAPARPAPKAPARRAEPPRPPPPEPVRAPEPVREPEPARGSLLITSTPTGLVVEVDGVRRDLTPAKVVVTAGTHAVSIWKGTTRLFQRSIEVDPNQVALVDADLTAQLAPVRVDSPTETPREPVAEKADKLKEDRRDEEPKDPPPPRPVQPPVVTAVAPVIPPATGELQIESLNVYGEVFVNGVSVGFPPVVAKKLPVAPATVEVRVDGTVRRSRVVEVVANKRTTVRIP